MPDISANNTIYKIEKKISRVEHCLSGLQFLKDKEKDEK